MAALGQRLRRWVRSAVALTVAVVLAGLVLSLGLGAILAAGQRDAAGRELDRRTEAIADEVSDAAGRYTGALRMAASAAGALPVLTREAFTEATRALVDTRLPGATSIAFLVPVADGQVAAVQQRWRARGVPELALHPAAPGREHIFSIFSVPLDGSANSRLGIDVTQSGPATQALYEARRSGQVTISDPYVLIIDQQLPAEQRQPSFSLTAPVYGPADAAGVRQVEGWVLMGLRGRDFMTGTLDRASQDLADISLHAPSVGGTHPLVAATTAAAGGRRDLTRQASITVAGRQWHVRVAATGTRLPGGRTGMPTVAAAAGTAVTLLLAGLVWVLATSRARAETRVRAATVKLTAATVQANTARDDLHRQTSYLTQVLDALDVAVVTCDSQGTVVHANRAALRHLPQPAEPLTAADVIRAVTLTRPDGTPVPNAQRPLARALAGESVNSMEVQLTSTTGSRLAVMMHARPLRDPDGTIVGAVTAAVDVTVLREREAELHGFAGVVAHDLRAPLAAIAGHTEDLAEDTPRPQLHARLDKISAGVHRMQQLIDDLLSYATARDAPLRTEPVDLQSLVADVITERTAHLRTSTAGAPVLFPDLYIGPLPAVTADRGMLRQLFDNLIGNALKYTMPGQPARVDISVHHRDTDPDGLTRLVIADRGIGIPAAELPHIFDTFHRAGDHTAYQGTGLGLAIWAATSFPDSGSTKIHFQKVRKPCPRSVGTILQSIARRP